MTPLRLLVADDSPLFAAALTELIAADPELELVGVATDGAMAVDMTERLRPALVIMDVLMPVMNGLDAVSAIMARRPTPILVTTADAGGRSGELTFEALRRGALDFARKPDGWPLTQDAATAWRARLKLLAVVPVVYHSGWGRRPAPTEPEAPLERAPRAIGMVASTGGPAVLVRVLTALPSGFPSAIVVVQHLAGDFTRSLTSWLRRSTALEVEVAESGAPLTAGTVFVAPHDRHAVVRGGRIELTLTPPRRGHRPSGTELLASVASAYGREGGGIVLTGMGEDGAEGLLALRRAGGLTIAQDAASAVVYGMPEAAARLGAAQHVLSVDGIIALLSRLGKAAP